MAEEGTMLPLTVLKLAGLGQGSCSPHLSPCDGDRIGAHLSSSSFSLRFSDFPSTLKEIIYLCYKAVVKNVSSNQSILKEISPGISLEGMMLKLKLQYFGHLM